MTVSSSLRSRVHASMAGNQRHRPLLDAGGRRIGMMRMKSPKHAGDWSLPSGGPAAPAGAIITGIATGRVTVVLDTDPGSQAATCSSPGTTEGIE